MLRPPAPLEHQRRLAGIIYARAQTEPTETRIKVEVEVDICLEMS